MTTTSLRAIAPTKMRNSLANPRYLATGKPHAERMAPKLLPMDNIERQQAIENALSAALWHVRHGTGQISMQAATGRTMRAASMLKQACIESTISRRA